MNGFTNLAKIGDFGGAEYRGESQGSHAQRGQIDRCQVGTAWPLNAPFARSLIRIPGGVITRLHLAWLSEDPRARLVAKSWKTLSAWEKRFLAVEDLCPGAGITAGEFIEVVARTGWELGAAGLTLPGSTRTKESVMSAYGRALMTGEPIRAWDPAGYKRRRNHLQSVWEHRVCGHVETMRRRWRLSQPQFADLFMADVRTIKRWEAREAKPTMRHRWFLRLFARYVERHGVRQLRLRFVGQPPRYGKRGPASGLTVSLTANLPALKDL